ncbi:histone H1 [Dysgonomonas sp. 25]|uniref:histone H1 n=1 Tax=Dysgonomonas sp. 25 TaxID=2302933 RepID=UPI0013D875C9|nr:histone H1 [Dysgonomonas sp. 25]NDV68150.1 histone H1 [Dysgonomonas sp. 25]
MKNLVENLNQLFAEFAKDATAQVENGNKAAGTRARKTSLAIEKALKEFRKVSIEDSKK